METKKLHYAWVIALGGTVLTTMLVPPCIALYGKYLIAVVEELKVSYSAFTFSNTILQALGIFISPFVAAKMASGNMRRMQSLSIIGFALAYASFGLAQNVYWFYVSAFVLGIFFIFSAIIPVSIAITNWFEKKRGLAMSLVMAGIGLGGFIFSPVITALLQSFGWRATYMIMGLIIFVVAFPVSAFLMRAKPSDKGLKPYGAEDGGPSQAVAHHARAVTLGVKESQSKAFFWLLMIGVMLTGIINSGVLGQFPPALQQQYGPVLQATIISLYSLIGVGGKLLIGWINDRWGVVASSVFGCVTFGLSILVMILGGSPAMAYLMAVFLGLGMAIGPVSPPLLTAGIFGQAKYGQVYGKVNSFLQAGLCLGSFITAAIRDAAGTYTPAWILLLVLTALTLLCWVSSYAASRKYC